jgi:SagB-type dehydrogenase family enzyme
MVANLMAVANAEGLEAEVVAAFADGPVEKLIEADGEREGIMCIVSIGRSQPAQAQSPEVMPLGLETIPLSGSEVAYPDLIQMHSVSRLESSEEIRAVTSGGFERISLQARNVADPSSSLEAMPAPIEDDAGMGLGETILRRGSTRLFARESIGADELAAVMAASSGHPKSDFPRLTETYLIVNAVEGLKPGAYYYRRESGAFELIREGDFRAEAGYLCLEQPLGADCSALIVYMAELEQVLAGLGNRGYRDAHLEAGMMGGRAYLASYALERGATGLTFYDEDTTRFFAPHAVGMSPILMVAIGVPETKG